MADLQFSFSANAFRKHTFFEAADAISAAGYTGLEIMCDRPHAYPEDLSGQDINLIKRKLARKGLAIANLNAFMMCAVGNFHHPSWIEEDKDYRKLRIQYTKDCIDLAARLEVATLSTEPGGPLNVMRPDIALEMFAEGLSLSADYALEKGVRILIEPEPGLLIQTSDEFIAFMDIIGHPGVGLNFDVGHFYCVNEDPAEKISQLKDYIFHFHLEDIAESRNHRHILLGEGGIDIAGVLEAITMIEYQGFITVELYPYLDSAFETAKKARNYLKDVCGYG